MQEWYGSHGENKGNITESRRQLQQTDIRYKSSLITVLPLGRKQHLILF